MVDHEFMEFEARLPARYKISWGRGKRIFKFVSLMPVATFGAILSIELMQGVVRLGHRIPQSNLSLDYCSGMVWAVGLGVSIFLWPVAEADKPILVLLWASRIFVTLVGMLPYESHYPLDANFYFRNATSNIRYLPPQIYTNTHRFQELVNLINAVLPVPNSFHAIKVTFAMIGLIGVYVFYRAAVLFLGREDRRILLIVGLTPSIAFWGSIIGKDPIAMFGMALYTYGVTVLCKKRLGMVSIACMASGIGLASFIRVWMAIIMVAPLGVIAWLMTRNILAKVVMTAAALTLTVALIGPLMKMFAAATVQELVEQIANKQGNAFDAGGSAAGESISIQSWGDLVKFAPIGAFSALFRPLPGEVKNAFGLAAGAEDAALLLLALRALLRMGARRLRDPIVLWALVLLLLWAILYGLISSHNMGTAVRYRLQVLPLLMLLLLYLGRSPRSEWSLA